MGISFKTFFDPRYRCEKLKWKSEKSESESESDAFFDF